MDSEIRESHYLKLNRGLKDGSVRVHKSFPEHRVLLINMSIGSQLLITHHPGNPTPLKELELMCTCPNSDMEL